MLIAYSICLVTRTHPVRAELPALIERRNKRMADCFGYGREVPKEDRQTNYPLIMA
ncbi:MAG: hypothetical protein LBI03_01930 [Clostridiales bacterium]|nr:hypothetical protein [Clostridiales bacterium]